MNELIRFLKLGLPYFNLAETVARNIDQNDTGIDDEAADKIKEFTIFISKTIAANSDTSATVVRGYEAIFIFGSNVINALTLLETAQISKEEKIAKGEELIAMLSDPTKVYQPKKGKDADLLAKFKRQAAEKLSIF